MKRFYCLLVGLLFVTSGLYAQGTPSVVWIPATAFHASVDSSAALDASDLNTITSLLGGAEFKEISTFGIGGWQMSSIESVATLFPWPGWNHNPVYPVAFRLWWTSTSGDDDGGIKWGLYMEEKALGSEAALELADSTMADAITFAADSTEVQYGVNVTSWDTIGVVALSTYNYETLVQMSVKLRESGTASADELHLLGVEMFFVPKDFRGARYHVPGSTQHGTAQGITLPRRAGF